MHVCILAGPWTRPHHLPGTNACKFLAHLAISTAQQSRRSCIDACVCYSRAGLCLHEALQISVRKDCVISPINQRMLIER